MEERFRQIWSNKYVTWGHLLLDFLVLAGSLLYFIDGSPAQMTKYTVLSCIIAVCMIMELINWKMSFTLINETWAGKLYYCMRPVYFLVYYYISNTKIEGIIFLLLLLFSMAELILHIAVKNRERRIVIYGLFLAAFGMVSIVMLVSLIQDEASRVTFITGLREIMTVVAMLVIVLFIGEAMAAMWSCFEQQIFKQNRVLDDLNEANEDLKQQQEKNRQINEKLGMQKIELQTANKRINRSHDEMSVQNEISSVIASTVKREEMLEKIANIMQIRLDMDYVAIILEEDNSLLVPGEEPQGRFVALATCLGESFKKGLLDSVYTTDLSEILTMTKGYVQNTQTESVKLFRCLSDEQELTSVICVPIMSQEERLGTLVVGKNRLNAFMDGRAFYENIAGQLSVGIYNARLYAKMSDMAIRDGLTRIYNRRHLTELLADYFQEAIAKRMSVTIAMFDIDKFKMVNDTYGHQCGDEVIRYVASLLNRGAIKHGGIASRYGGEEFVIAFLDKGLDDTYEIVKQIHEQIRHEDVKFEDKTISVRVSAGVASYPETCQNPSDLLTRADWAMYHSKRNGRDQITIDSDSIEDKM